MANESQANRYAVVIDATKALPENQSHVPKASQPLEQLLATRAGFNVAEFVRQLHGRWGIDPDDFDVEVNPLSGRNERLGNEFKLVGRERHYPNFYCSFGANRGDLFRSRLCDFRS
jgi:hypothetical protein